MGQNCVMLSKEQIKEWLKENLSEERYNHILGAEETARELAKRFGIDEENASIAALTHDAAKGISPECLLEMIDENNIPISEMERKSKKTLHAPVSAFIAQKEFGITDPEVLDAIRWHTLGRINMSVLEKIVFLADKIEPNTRDSGFREKVLSKLNETNNLNEALLLCYNVTIKSLVDRKLVINPQTIEVWNNLLASLNSI